MTRRNSWIAWAEALLISLLGASICSVLNTPLPWMIGPLTFVAAGRFLDRDIRLFPGGREAGQWVIGAALGLYFTPVVVRQLAGLAPWVILASLFAILLGLGSALLLQRLSRVDFPTAFFAMAVGGASEMAAQGERNGARVDRVAAAHSLRIMIVVVAIPFVFKFSSVQGRDTYLPGADVVDYGGVMALIALTSALAMMLRRLKSPNAWVIGPLFVSMVLTASDNVPSALPQWMINGGQLLIGCSLGSRFSADFFRTAPRFMASVGVTVVSAVVVAAGFGWLLGLLSGNHPATLILATAPGGIAEMSITAKVLHLGVPVVTAFHVTRLVVLVTTIAPVFRWASRRFDRDRLVGSREGSKCPIDAENPEKDPRAG